MSKNSKEKLTVIARAPFNVYYEGEARSVSALNKVGPFDVLPGHADFFSVLEPGQVVIDTGSDEPVSFNVSSGIITARDNQINLFVDI